MNKEFGHLFIVASPIGNLADISLRALDILKSVNIILVEDSRKSSHLLNYYDIKNKKLVACHQHSSDLVFEKIYKYLESGEDLALLSDAGTPGINDPSNRLIEYLLKKNENIQIHPIPGASALTALLSLVGKDINPFIYIGFLPHKKGREKIFKNIIEKAEYNFVFLDNPHRLIKNLEKFKNLILEANLNPEDFYLVLGRELTKIHESIYRASLVKILELIQNDKNFKGEVIVFISKR